jgi:DNA-directed RNA polymerase specialized sigma24 family protein
MSHVHSQTAAIAPVSAVPDATATRRSRVSLGECILAASDRDADAAEIVAKALRPRLLEEIEKTLGEHAQDAEDVVDALFLEMLDGGVTIAAGGSPIHRLMCVARNRARNHLHELRRDEEEDD